MQIDAHQHFWRLDRGDYGWLTPALEPLYRDFGPSDLAATLHRHGIAKTILVQAAPTLAETRYLLNIAAETEFVAGVVGWADFASPGAAAKISDLSENPLLVGLRPMVQDIVDDDWMLDPILDPAFRAMISRDLVFDALTLPRHLSRLREFSERYTEMTIVVDHGSKPGIRERRLEPWRDDIAAVARLPNTFCKLSGLVTEANLDWSVDDLRPYVEELLVTFGADRLLWGSDWPVVNLAGGYDRWRAATHDLLSSLDQSSREAVLGANAARVYLDKRGKR